MTPPRELEHIAAVESLSHAVALGLRAIRIGKLKPEPSADFTTAKKAFYAAAREPKPKPRKKAKDAK